jgi:bacterioferritin (cytochrome b1)
VFIHALRKLAAQDAPAPDADLIEHTVKVVRGEKASPAEAAMHTQAGVPDETGRLEGKFAVPLDQIVMTLAQIVSNSMRQHTAYAFYGEMMRDLGRGELAELFDKQGQDEMNEMKYFLRRMSVLHPGGVPIPVAPTPEPSADVMVALRYLIAGEQQAIVLFKTLHSMLGDNPMKYTIEQMMTNAQEHLDRLWQYMPVTEASTQASNKIASVITRMKLAARARALQRGVNKSAASSVQRPSVGFGAVPVSQYGADPFNMVVGREALLQQAQLMNENQDLRARLDQAAQQQLMAQQQIESLSAENENLQMQAMAASEQAQMAAEQAQRFSEQAAAQADAKMRLAIRVQQLRQNLADIVSADPVQEEGVGFGEQAGPGNIATSSQQNQAAQQDAAMDPTGGFGVAPTQEAAREQQQAINAQQEAVQQTAQAQQKTEMDILKKDTMKTSGVPSFADKSFISAGQAIGKGIGQHLEQAGSNALRKGLNTLKEQIRAYSKNPKVIGGTALAAGGYIGAKVHGIKKQQERDQVQKEILKAIQSMANNR